jgi:hypothetical protein
VFRIPDLLRKMAERVGFEPLIAGEARLLDKARAHRKGMPYQSFIKGVLADAVGPK